MKIAQVTGQAALNAITALLNNGTMVVYSGTQPTNPDTALSGNTALVTGTLSATAFGTATISGGYAQANASFTSTTPTISVSGTASFARWYETGGSVAVMDWTVGTSGTDITVPTTTFTNGVTLTLGAFTLKQPVG